MQCELLVVSTGSVLINSMSESAIAESLKADYLRLMRLPVLTQLLCSFFQRLTGVLCGIMLSKRDGQLLLKLLD